MKAFVAASAALLAVLGTAHGSAVPISAFCKNVTYTVAASAQNYNYTPILPDLNDPQVLSGDLANDVFTTFPVSGVETLAATYCAPLAANANNAKLQVLFHSITSNKEYWMGLSPAYEYPSYSYQYFMAELGYPTLAIDRLGNGQSSHPDPITVVQVPFEVELYHNLFKQIRSNKNNTLPKAYPYFIYVGHSLGSEIGSNIMKKYPTDFDTVILSGFSKQVLPALAGIDLQNAVPAAVQNPAKYGNLSAGYLTASVGPAHINSFFGPHDLVDFDQAVGNEFFTTEDVVSVGQFIGAFTAIATAYNYTGRVLVLTGEEDEAFCGFGNSAVGPPGCGALLPDTGTALFPNSSYSWYPVPKTGHAVNLHQNRLLAFGVAAEFLAGKSFAG